MSETGVGTVGSAGAPLSPRERADLGRAARARVPRSSHGDFEPAADRPDVVDIVERQSATRLQELIPIRYGRMTETPFRFYRGAAAVMACDLANTPASGLRVQLCGDAHMLNFRLVGSPERQLLFDINDFDETLPGPWEWDVKRLAASLVIAGRENEFEEGISAGIVRTCVRSYRETMRAFAGLGNLEVWYAKNDPERVLAAVANELGKGARKRMTTAMAKARTRDSMNAFEKLTELVDGERLIRSDPPLIRRLDDVLSGDQRLVQRDSVTDIIERYGRSLSTDRRHLLEQFHVVDVARKVVGVGSVGTRCWIVLLLGRDGDDPLFLQAKEASESVLAQYVGASEYATQGERVVAGQRLMQTASDIFLGWEHAVGIDGLERDFYVRQLRDWKGIAQPSLMLPQDMSEFAALCGATLARAHARSGDRIAIAAYLGGSDSFDKALVRFASSYADQNDRDHASLVAAVKSGRVSAQAG
ncbi:DUF2252 domain-containing protein [Streptacidiphilus rugosus]|uniref:DUF2252 domain-containing protein n=1 Tax=Streptacidiphilus rugosus TaxID=405783 RepID=UPI0005687CB2|nr:DUF2252 domain-containing protein [Streptacidiphilus rugosus]